MTQRSDEEGWAFPAIPVGREVPFSSALGGLALIAIVFSLSDPVREVEIVGLWFVVYAVELVLRNRARAHRWLELPEVAAAALSALILAMGAFADALASARPIVWAFYAAVYLVGGWGPLVTGLRALRRGTVDAELLMVVAALSAAGVGKPFDGALLFVIFVSSRAVAALATRRTRDSVAGLLSLAPEHARLDGDRLVPVDDLALGDVFLLRPGDRVCADGEVVDGRSELHEASITGEPLPVERGVGDDVFAGTVNGTGSLRVRVTRLRPDSVLARIVATVAEASETKSRQQNRLERIERGYSFALVAVTAAYALLPLGFGVDPRDAVLRAMAFMIVASPCAFTLATMPALLAAIAHAGRRGVLVKNAEAMDRLAGIDVVAFDKTGSLTLGAPHVLDVVPVAGHDADAVLALAAAAEQDSEHPLGAAVVAEAVGRRLELADATEFRYEPGRGVHACVEGRRVSVGRPAAPVAAARVGELTGDGATELAVLLDDEPAALIVLRDRVRPEAADAVAQLTQLTRAPVLLTGDGPDAAREIAGQVGIEDVRARLLPTDKLDAVRELQAGGNRVAYVGDGINDAPALAGADVGVAMAHGADLVLETGDVVVVRNDLAALPALVELSRRARRVVRQNLTLAGAVVVALVVLDVSGLLPLAAAVAGHEVSTLFVAVNGLRLLRAPLWTDTSAQLRRRLAARYVLGLIVTAGLVLLAVYSLSRYE